MIDSEMVTSYDWCNKKYVHSTKKENVNGRTIVKIGNKQSVWFTGIVYKLDNCDKNFNKYSLHIGLSKQHPNDIQYSKEIGIEKSIENTLINPIITMTCKSVPSEKFFQRIVSEYYITNVDDNLSFIKTKGEMKLENKKTKN